MRGFSVLALCFFLAAAVSVDTNCDEKYSTEYDEIEIEDILKGALFENYVLCLKTGQKCTAQGKRLKEVLPEALATLCCRCSPKQIENARKVIHFLLKEKPAVYLDLERLFDKERKFRERYGDKVKEAGLEFPN